MRAAKVRVQGGHEKPIILGRPIQHLIPPKIRVVDEREAVSKLSETPFEKTNEQATTRGRKPRKAAQKARLTLTEQVRCNNI